jgi:8-oxo-dGTP pyrophosphatase MutT (NUDIX family)
MSSTNSDAARQRVAPQPTHAGGVVHRRADDGGFVILLVRASKSPFEWVLPKGHIEAGESPAEAAVREVREETGVRAVVERAIASAEFVSPRGEHVRTLFFLMTCVGSGVPHEPRAITWCSFDEASRLIPFENLRVVIDAARSAIQQ